MHRVYHMRQLPCAPITCLRVYIHHLPESVWFAQKCKSRLTSPEQPTATFKSFDIALVVPLLQLCVTDVMNTVPANNNQEKMKLKS